MTRTGDAAVHWALAHSSWHPVGTCLIFVRSAFDRPAGTPSATAAWNRAVHKHRVSHGSQVPRAVPVLWTGGSHGFGHVAVSLGNGLCRSTDWPSAGRVSTVAIDTITRSWRSLRFQGWSEDLNGGRVWTPRPNPPMPDNTVALHNLRPGDRNNDVKQMQQRLSAKGCSVPATGFFGPLTREAVKKWQAKLGYRGKDADGIPGKTSMQRLGFRVNA
jgi:hypothetical protein